MFRKVLVSFFSVSFSLFFVSPFHLNNLVVSLFCFFFWIFIEVEVAVNKREVRSKWQSARESQSGVREKACMNPTSVLIYNQAMTFSTVFRVSSSFF